MPDAVTKEQVVGQIRFALSGLSSANGQHRFEDVCRNFARLRITPNILPATGPVGFGGDQGRDFETFRTFISTELGPHGGFAGHASEGPLAFACTTQQNGLPTKIRGDVKAIMSSGTSVVAIYVFLTAPLPVAARHQIQDEVEKEHGVGLEILDGVAIAEALADRSTFWIAEQYLSIPASYRPQDIEDEEAVPAWYIEDRDRWRTRNIVQPVRGELSDVIDGLRHATFNVQARQDLPFWIELVRPLATNAEAPTSVRQRARYEVSVAQLRGLGDMRPADEFAFAYLMDSLVEHDPVRLQDAAVLLTYTGTAVALGHSDLNRNEVGDLGRQLRAHVSSLLEDDPPPTRRARLLEVLGRLCLVPDADQVRGREENDENEGIDAATMLDELRDLVPPNEVVASLQASDLETGVAAWHELALALESTPLFPVESWSELLAFYTPLLFDRPEWPEIESAVDAAIERLHGGTAVAKRARDRAIRLQQAGRLRDALAELHLAKDRLWTGDHLRGALLCMLAISDIYKGLGLPFAAKQYALAVAGTAQADGRDDVAGLVPHAVFVASEADYFAGGWAGAIELVDVGLMLHALLVDSEVDPWVDRDMANSLITTGMALRAARVLRPELVGWVESVASRHGMLEPLKEVENETGSWDAEEWEHLADSQLLGRPFNDIGSDRVFRFAALGTNWTVTALNDYVNCRAAERFVAAAQLLLVELADFDLCFLPSDIEVVVQIADDEESRNAERVDELSKERRWVVKLTPFEPGGHMDPEHVFVETLSALSVVMLDVSLLPDSAFMEAIQEAFGVGLGSKLAAGRPYDEMAEIVTADHYAGTPRGSEAPLSDSVPRVFEHPELAWQSGPGPTYDPQTAVEMVTNRYERIPRLIPRTLQLLAADASFEVGVTELRDRGWRDWHVLTALANISINHRLGLAGLNTAESLADPRARRRAELMGNEPETDEYEPSIGQFTVDDMDAARRGAIPSLLVGWGLVLRRGSLDVDACERLLTSRYAYWDDDVPHDDPFESVS